MKLDVEHWSENKKAMMSGLKNYLEYDENRNFFIFFRFVIIFVILMALARTYYYFYFLMILLMVVFILYMILGKLRWWTD